MSGVEQITHHLAAERFRDGLHIYAGCGRRFSVAALADAASIPERTMKSYHAGEATPGLHNFLRICAVLPPAFTNHVLEISGLTGARHLMVESPCGHTTMKRLAERMHMLADAMQDGYLDHVESKQLAPPMRELATEISSFAEGLSNGSR